MPIFTQDEYDDSNARPSLDEAWRRLPVVRRVAGLRVRWLGPLVDLGHERWIGDLSQAAWGYLEGCGWQRAMEDAGPMLDGRGRVRARWAAGLTDAVERLAAEGERTGPEGDRDRWASWVCLEMAEPSAVIQAAAIKRGWDR